MERDFDVQGVDKRHYDINVGSADGAKNFGNFANLPLKWLIFAIDITFPKFHNL